MNFTSGHGLTPRHPIVLSVNRLSVGYPGLGSAIEDVSFDVTEGERIAVIGPNGAGKSTLMKAIVGLIPFTSGEISILGHDCRSSHDLVGYVPQHEAIDWDFPVNVMDVVMMGRARRIGWLRRPSAHDRAIVHEALERVGMTDLARRQIGQLSGGQKRRVFIARALAQGTRILLLDEPFSGVDVAVEQEVMQTLDHLRRDRITVLLATHDLNTAATRFDRILLLKRRVIACGTAEEVFRREALSEAYGSRVGIFNEPNQPETIVVADDHWMTASPHQNGSGPHHDAD
jgi:manganese/zinc/iron transport system ATP- binding protein